MTSKVAALRLVSFPLSTTSQRKCYKIESFQICSTEYKKRYVFEIRHTCHKKIIFKWKYKSRLRTIIIVYIYSYFFIVYYSEHNPNLVIIVYTGIQLKGTKFKLPKPWRSCIARERKRKRELYELWWD